MGRGTPQNLNLHLVDAHVFLGHMTTPGICTRSRGHSFISTLESHVILLPGGRHQCRGLQS
eukprot:931145-Amphidinium_carterae.1